MLKPAACEESCSCNITRSAMASAQAHSFSASSSTTCCLSTWILEVCGMSLLPNVSPDTLPHLLDPTGSRLVVSTVLTPLLLTTSLLVFLLIFASRSYLSSQAWIYSTVIPHGNHSPPSNLPVSLCSYSHIALASHQSSEIQQIIVQPYHSKFQKGADKVSSDERPNIGLHWEKHCIH